MNKNIIMICYYYPPLTEVGCKRSVAFSKYLNKHGWNPHVISVKNADRAYCVIGSDEPPPGVPTEYTYSIMNIAKLVGRANGLLSRILKLFGIQLNKNIFYELFCIPDYFLGWIPLTTLKGYRLIKKLNTGIIYVSCTPTSSAVIGVLLKFLTGRPLVMDFRDPYALESVLIRYGHLGLRRKIDRFIEDILLKHADIFVVTTEETRQSYISQYPYMREKIFTVHNGFDAEHAVQQRASKYQKFTIVYNGNFYLYALKSAAFFGALALLKSRGKIDISNFQFIFYGDEKPQIEEIAHQYGIEDIVIADSRIPYKDVLLVLSKSHLQLLRIVKPMISTKFFEGIPLDVPFLATIPSGEVEELVRKYSPNSYIITEDSAEQIADAILDAMAKYRDGEMQHNHIQEFIEDFSRENLTLKLINIMETNLMTLDVSSHLKKSSGY